MVAYLGVLGGAPLPFLTKGQRKASLPRACLLIRDQKEEPGCVSSQSCNPEVLREGKRERERESSISPGREREGRRNKHTEKGKEDELGNGEPWGNS